MRFRRGNLVQDRNTNERRNDAGLKKHITYNVNGIEQVFYYETNDYSQKFKKETEINK